MPEFAYERNESKISAYEAESKDPGREPSAGSTQSRIERKNDDPVECGFEYTFGDDAPAEAKNGHASRELGISEEDLAEADKDILDHLNQDLSRVEELEELLEGEPERGVCVLRLTVEIWRCNNFNDTPFC